MDLLLGTSHGYMMDQGMMHCCGRDVAHQVPCCPCRYGSFHVDLSNQSFAIQSCGQREGRRVVGSQV